MENLEVIELYENANQEKAKTFIDTAESTLKVQTEKKYITRDIEWINMMEEVILMRIEEIERKISDIESTEVYKILDKEKILLVKDPVRKTNVVLKNVHFQYAMRLWEFLKVNFDEQTIESEDNKDYMDNGQLKKMMDEAFLLQYLAMKTLDEDTMEKQDTKKEIKAIVVEQMLDKMLDLDEDMTEEQLRQLVAEKYEVIKYKKMAVLQDIQKIFKKYFDQYQDMVEMKGN